MMSEIDPVSKLSSCPFCGHSCPSELLVVIQSFNGQTYASAGFNVKCQQCGAYGPNRANDIDAREAWIARSYTLTADRTLWYWRPIETAPRDDTSVDLWVESNWTELGRRITDAWWCPSLKTWLTADAEDGLTGICLDRTDQATHWMPSPGGPA